MERCCSSSTRATSALALEWMFAAWGSVRMEPNWPPASREGHSSSGNSMVRASSSNLRWRPPTWSSPACRSGGTGMCSVMAMRRPTARSAFMILPSAGTSTPPSGWERARSASALDQPKWPLPRTTRWTFPITRSKTANTPSLRPHGCSIMPGLLQVTCSPWPPRMAMSTYGGRTRANNASCMDIASRASGWLSVPTENCSPQAPATAPHAYGMWIRRRPS